MAQIKRSNRRRDLSPVHPDAAAIDIGATMHVAAVSPERDPEPVRTCGTVAGEFHRLGDWFESCGIKTVAMESTGVYWIPAYEVLEQRGFEVVLVNARDAKHVPRRKSDVRDAEWLQRLHECSGAASVPRARSPHCGRTCVSASACWMTRPPT